MLELVSTKWHNSKAGCEGRRGILFLANVGTVGSSCLMWHAVSILGGRFFSFFGGSGTGSCYVSQADL